MTLRYSQTTESSVCNICRLCMLIPIEGCENNPKMSSTLKTTNHIPCGFAYKVVGLTSSTSQQPVVYRGLDAADKFVEWALIN
jgi:hypothetical protein